MQELGQTEINRRAYLQAMGIVQYQARTQLPHAAVSNVLPMPIWEEPAPESDVGASNDHSGVTENPTPYPAQREASNSRSANHQVAETSEDQAASAQSHVDIQEFRVRAPVERQTESVIEQAKPAEVLRFALYVSAPVKSCVVVSALANPVAGTLAPMEAQFIDDLLRAIGGESGLSQHGRFFKWPMISNPNIPQGMNEANDALHSVLKKWCSPAAVTTIFCLGGHEILQDISQAEHPLNGLGITTVQLPELVDVFQDWRQKRALWQRLQQCLPT